MILPLMYGAKHKGMTIVNSNDAKYACHPK